MLADVDYQFRIGPEKVPQGITIFLVDQYLGSAIPVSNGDSTYYHFTINAADPASAATDRFMLVFTRGNAAATANNHFPVTLSSPVRVDGKNTGSTPVKSITDRRISQPGNRRRDEPVVLRRATR